MVSFTSPETIDHAALQRLVTGGAVHGVDVIGPRAGWAVVVKDGMREKVAESLADPRPNIPNEQAMTELQAVIDAARKKRALKAAP